MPLVDLPLNVVVFDDRARDQLREKRNIEQNLNKRSGNDRPVAIHIHHIGQALKGEERDADRQHDAGQRQAEAEQTIDRADRKIRVFEHREHPDAARHGKRHTEFGVFPRRQQTADVIEQHRNQQQRQIHRLAECVEDQARRKQQRIFKPHAAHEAVEHKHRRQKNE